MSEYATRNHWMIGAIAWKPEDPATRINDHILMSKSTSNAYVVTSDAGDVVINTGMPHEGARTRERFEQLLGRPLDVSRIIYTQSHPDHIGGWEFFAHPGTQTVVQREFPRIAAERKRLGPFFQARNARVLAALTPPTSAGGGQAWFTTKDPENLTLFADEHQFTLGGRTFRSISTPSGETLDALCVWIPEERTLFTGNWMGALYGALPHFYTVRGDRQRSIVRFIEDLDKMIALQPALLITGHEEPIAGKDRIAADLTKLREAVAYIHDETVRGMNDQKDVHALMESIQLPPRLEMKPGRGPVSWYVRAVWEEYAGWFHHDSTTELYGRAPHVIWDELARMAGGADALAASARNRVSAGEPVAAMHFIDIAEHAYPKHREVLEAKLSALEALVQANRGLLFDELGWLEGQIIATRAALEKDQQTERPA